jgi:phosphoribosylformylglycinamidine synthase
MSAALRTTQVAWTSCWRVSDHRDHDWFQALTQIAPIGSARYNNEFGRPCLAGVFRTLTAQSSSDANEWRGYHKPIMIAGGLGTVREQHSLKRAEDVLEGAHVIVLGGPAMLIGLGGGAASSNASGHGSADLDFDSVQRGNPEMQRRAQMVINTCVALGEQNPIAMIHDVGAGGLSNALPGKLAKLSRRPLCRCSS